MAALPSARLKGSVANVDLADWHEHRDLWGVLIIGTLAGVGGREVGDYTSLNRPCQVLIIGIKAPYPPKGPI